MTTRLSPTLVRKLVSEFEERSDLKVPAVLKGSAASAIGYSLAQQAWAHGRQKWKQHRTWTVTVSGDNELYYQAQLWLMENGQSMSRKALTAETFWVQNNSGPNKLDIRFLADDDTTQTVKIEGFDVEVSVNDNELPGVTKAAGNVKPPKLVFETRTRAGRDAVIDLLTKLRDDSSQEKRQPGLMVLDKWSDWRRRSDLPPRPMESVIVKGDVVEELFKDLKEFLDQEEDYVRRAIPWHRSYLLVGPPGTGKTSAVKAVTNALALDLWYAQLSGIDKDAKLADVFGEVRTRGALLLEDIDSLPAAIDRTGEDAPEGDISTSGLLNALDGVATPHGLITIMSTNHPEHLDPALMRPGRVDRVFEFHNPDTETVHRHFKFFYGQPPTAVLDPQGRSSAAISEIFKRNMNDPDGAQAAIVAAPTEDDEREWHAGAAGFLDEEASASV